MNEPTNQPTNNSAAGFTLIELSIVLVIIGLIVGGIVGAQDLIRQAQINKLVTDSREVFTKIRTFQVKYGRIPGELYNYQQFFPTLVGPYCPKTTNLLSSVRNNIIDNTYEAEAAFAQLHAAGLIEIGRPQILQNGTVQTHYDCIYNNMQQSAGLVTPWGNIWGIFVPPSASLPNRNIIRYGDTFNPVLTVAEAKALDEKYDDGKPFNGLIRAGRTNLSPSTYCTSTHITTDTTATYYMTHANEKTCQIFIAEGV